MCQTDKELKIVRLKIKLRMSLKGCGGEDG